MVPKLRGAIQRSGVIYFPKALQIARDVSATHGWNPWACHDKPVLTIA